MRPADRLFQIIQYLRFKKTATAADLAHHLEVSLRTIYRDIQDLVLAQVPIFGEAGVGYRLAPGFDIPPLMFQSTELEALVLGARMVMAWGDQELAQGAEQALSKIEEVLPKKLKQNIAATTLFAPDFHIQAGIKTLITPLRKAILEKHLVHFLYGDAKGHQSLRTVRSLGLFFWGSRWSLLGFCETRQDFRSFRLDRILKMEILETHFKIESGQTLQDFLQKTRVDDCD